MAPGDHQVLSQSELAFSSVVTLLTSIITQRMRDTINKLSIKTGRIIVCGGSTEYQIKPVVILEKKLFQVFMWLRIT